MARSRRESTAPPRALAPRLAMAAALLIAAALRLWNLRHGLPDFLDEAIPFRRALMMWGNPGGGIDWNPHFFQYPSLTIYLHLALQQIGYHVGAWFGAYQSPPDYHVAFHLDPTPMAIVARLAQVAADLVTVWMAGRLGERLHRGSGAAVALLTACSPVLIEGARAIYTDTLMTALALAALDRMLAYRANGRGRTLATAAALIGLATGAKYPAAVLVLPLGWVLWSHGGARALRRWPAATGLALLVFLATTPGALFDFATFARELAIVRSVATLGHLGNLCAAGFGFYLVGLVGEIHWPGVVLVAASLVFHVARRATRAEAVTLALALLGFAVPISIGRAEADRYLMPLLPVAAVFLVALLGAIAERSPGRFRLPAFIGLCALFAVPALRAGLAASVVSTDDTRIEARRWCEAHLQPGDVLVQEMYGAPLPDRATWLRYREFAEQTGVSAGWRGRIERMKWYDAVTLPLSVVGTTRVTVRRPDGSLIELEIFPHVVDLNQMVYEPRLLAGVDYVLTSGGVRRRFEAEPARFAPEMRLYALLDSTAEVATRIAPKRPNSGPDITVYHLGPRFRAALERLGGLEPLWWAACVPRAYREHANAVFTRAGEVATLAPRATDSALSPWTRSLRRLFEDRLQALVADLAGALERRARCAPARDLARATLEMTPEDVTACLIFAQCSGRLGDWGAARAAIERTLAALEAAGGAPPVLRFEHAETLARTGDLERARLELERVAASGDPVLAAQARLALGSAGGPFRPAR